MHLKSNPTRRTFLRGIGGAVVALPILESATARPAAAVPMRMLCVGNNFGFVPKLFFPTETGAADTMPELLEPMAAYQDQFTILFQLDHGYDPKILGVDTRQPIKLGVWFGSHPGAVEKTTTRGRNLVAVFTLKDNQAKTFKTEVWMPEGGVPFFNWINDSGAAKGPLSRIVRTYHPEADQISKTEADQMREAGQAITDEEVARHNARLKTVASVYRGPMIDPSSRLLSGEEIKNASDLRAVLVVRKDLVLRNLVGQLLTYGTGRGLGFRDQEEIDRIILIAKRLRLARCRHTGRNQQGISPEIV
jgi:hypothetical protein